MQCQEEYQRRATVQINQNEGLSKQAKNVIKYLESTFECSGLCQETFFFYSLPLTRGRPQKPCLGALNETVGEEMIYLGIVFQATSLLLFFMTICTCPLFCFDNDLAIREAAAERDSENAQRQILDEADFSSFANL